MSPLVLALGVVAVRISGAPEWTLAKDDAAPFCFAERRLATRLIAISYNAIEGKSAILFVAAKTAALQTPSSAAPVKIIAIAPASLRELKGFKYAGPRQFPNGSNAIVFESHVEDYLENMPTGDSFAASLDGKVLVAVEVSDIRTAIESVISCSRKAKADLLESL